MQMDFCIKTKIVTNVKKYFKYKIAVNKMIIIYKYRNSIFQLKIYKFGTIILTKNQINMKSFIAILFVALFLSSCAMVITPTTATGFIYSDVKTAGDVTSNSGSSKVGTGTVQSILGWIALGDASIETAAKSAGISKIHHVDYYTTNILGIYATGTIYVYGE